MNLDPVLFHLREAKEELDRTITEMASDPKYDFAAFQVSMSHLYHHLNTAWNGRDQTDAEFEECTDETFKRFRRFPRESEVFLE